MIPFFSHSYFTMCMCTGSGQDKFMKPAFFTEQFVQCCALHMWLISVDKTVFWLLVKSACTVSRLSFSPRKKKKKSQQAGGVQESGRDTARTVHPTDQSDIMLSSKSWVKEKEGEHSQLSHLSSQETAMCTEALLPTQWLDICLPMETSEQIPLFSLLLCEHFCFSY